MMAPSGTLLLEEEEEEDEEAGGGARAPVAVPAASALPLPDGALLGAETPPPEGLGFRVGALVSVGSGV
jgi:hypothetical protein